MCVCVCMNIYIRSLCCCFYILNKYDNCYKVVVNLFIHSICCWEAKRTRDFWKVLSFVCPNNFIQDWGSCNYNSSGWLWFFLKTPYEWLCFITFMHFSWLLKCHTSIINVLVLIATHSFTPSLLLFLSGTRVLHM